MTLITIREIFQSLALPAEFSYNLADLDAKNVVEPVKN